MNNLKLWNDDEVFLLKEKQHLNECELLELLPHRSIRAIRHKLTKLKYRKKFRG